MNTYREYIKKQNEERFSEKSKEMFLKIAEKKFQTTFIGALHEFEQEFGYLWGHGEQQPTVEQQKMRRIWEKVRNNILNKGNTQIRNLRKEAEQYKMEKQRYNYNFRVRTER